MIVLWLGWVLPILAQTGSPNPSIRYAELLGYDWTFNPERNATDVTLLSVTYLNLYSKMSVL